MSDTATPNEAAAQPAPVAATADSFSLEYVQQLRGEAAKYRNEKKDAVEAARAETTQQWESKLDEASNATAKLQSQLSSANTEMVKVTTALTLGVPSERVVQFAALLKGDSEEDIKSSAESAKELFGDFKQSVPATDPTQGTGGGKDLPLNGDPILAALTKAVGR
jgi:hypothetical protein